MNGPETKKDHTLEKPDATAREKRGEKPKLPPLDFAKLDLTVEKVEERISPSETNVFDK